MADLPDPLQTAQPQANAATASIRPKRGPWLSLMGATVLMLTLLVLRPGSFFDLGINTYGTWFLDSYAILASNDAQAFGLDVYKPNPLDPFHRPHVYSSWWLCLGSFGLTRADTLWVSLVLVGGFVLTALAALRPRRYSEAAFYAAVLLAPPMLLAINRANNDLVVFVLLAILPSCVLASSRIVRNVVPFLVAFATGLKYYPAAAALLLLTGRDRREARARVLIQALLFAVVGISIAGDLRRLPGLMPKTEGLMTFGSTAIPSMLNWRLGPWVLAAGIVGLAIAAALWMRQARSGESDRSAGKADACELRFVLGAALLCACFWLGMNQGYRWVFAVWLAPWLWREGFAVAPGTRDRLARATGFLLIAVLWTDSFIAIGLNRLLRTVPLATLLRWSNGLYALEQPMTWTFFACLLALLIRFLRSHSVLRRTA